MKTIKSEQISEAVRDICISANCVLSPDVRAALVAAREAETVSRAKNTLSYLLENADIAERDMVPICQDCGMAVLFVSVGQEVYIEGSLTDALNEGVRRGYAEGFLRKSVLSDPLLRVNSGDNTPAVIHYNIVPGDKLVIELAPKGFGSENKSKLYMLNPSEGENGVKRAVLETVRAAGGSPCPPLVVGVGIGSDFEGVAKLAKRALLRRVGEPSPLPHIARLERELLEGINLLGIGAAGFGGGVTALAVHVLSAPTHIAGLPVAVNISCHVTRHARIEL